MSEFEKMAKEFSTTTVNDTEYALTQEAYSEGGSFTDNDGFTHSGTWYTAVAIDKNGNEYEIYWTNVNFATEDESEACDWDNADYAIAI